MYHDPFLQADECSGLVNLVLYFSSGLALTLHDDPVLFVTPTDDPSTTPSNLTCLNSSAEKHLASLS